MKKPGNFHIPLWYLCLLGLLFLEPCVFAAVPIQEKSLGGAGVVEARRKLLAVAESYLGTPYRYAGIDRMGLDCSGLVYLSFREGVRVTVPRTAESIYAWAEKIATVELQPGDLVFFVTTGPGVSHVGIYAGEGRFIHSASEGPQTGVMYSRLDESYWTRNYKGAGRALPWDETQTMDDAWSIGSDSAGKSDGNGNLFVSRPYWAEPGFYAGFGAAWTWGGFFEGAPSLFRGISALATAGYKWPTYRAAVEFRPEWDRALGIARLPITLSFGTDIIQVFAGPAYTIGEPSFSFQNGNRYYNGGGSWLWELGFSAATPPIMNISMGRLSIYGELAWQPYFGEDGQVFKPKPDITANLRASTGLLFLYKL